MKVIDKKSLTQLTFTLSDANTKLRWEHKGEFEYQGIMYDVVEKSQNGDSISFLCWIDLKETALNEKLRKYTEYAFGQNNQTNKTKDRIQNFFKQLYYYPTLLKGQILSESTYIKNEFFNNFSFTSNPKKLESPPPRQSSFDIMWMDLSNAAFHLHYR
ncbi:MAG: hypothetical protein R2774_12190 [Saprospiraceae bacterium]